MRIAMVLPGLHQVVRGAEVAFEAIAQELAKRDNISLTLFGSGEERPGQIYEFRQVNCVPREWFETFWPKVPVLRHEYAYEELTFVANLFRSYNPKDYDLTITCSYPFTNWFLQWRGGKERPTHLFVTQNGDYPAVANHSEWRFFNCDGLVCINQEYFQRNQQRWNCKLITNGVNLERFFPRSVDRTQFHLPENVPLALMVSALIESKRVDMGIRAASEIEGLHLVVCGDGPERDRVIALGEQLMPGRFHWKKLAYNQMPDIYQTADIFLHMSMDEPFGNVYLEALATGLPIVTHDRPTTRWILEDTSILVDTTHVEQVVTGIKQALHQNSSEAILKRRSLVERRFSWQSIAQSYYDFCRDLLELRKAPSRKPQGVLGHPSTM
jgi:glycosyltransferase involved in cell wall biosynthesis